MSAGDFVKRKMWDERSWKGRAMGVGLAALFTGAVLHEPIWQYGLGVSNDVCEISDKTPKDYRVRPILWGLLEAYESVREEETDKGGYVVSMYLVHTKNVKGHEGDECHTKHISDNMWYFNTRSSDLYGDIEKGKIYKLKSVGWPRNFWTGLLSWTPNIVKAEEVAKPSQP